MQKNTAITHWLVEKTTPTIHRHEAWTNGNIQGGYGTVSMQLKQLVYFLNSPAYD